MAKKKKVTDPADPGPDLGLYAVYAGFGVLGTLWIALQLGNRMSATPQDFPINPIEIVAGLARGRFTWPTASTVIVLLVLLTVVAIILVRRQLRKRQGKGALPVDEKAQYMGSGGAIYGLTEAGVREKAEQLGMRLGYDDAPGVPLGIGVADGVMLYGSYEDLHLDIWGPRQGKSTSRVIPAILSAIGPVLATSNKRDVVDATRDVRESKGSPTFVFDPQGVADESPSWYWNPLAWVDAGREGCEMRAQRLAGHFADADNGGESGKSDDNFFDPEAEDLLAALFLAAAVAQRPITQVWGWVTNPVDTEPIELLRGVRHDFIASGLAMQYNADPRTRSGIFGTAKKMVRCLQLSNVHNWILPGSDPATGQTRRQFDELEFIERNGTLYCLSLEGRGSAAPLVSALTEAVIDVAMRKASRSRGGRLPIPLLAVLDEAANVVRWKDLPKQYSHFGSRGIVVMTVLQSWAQGARCWGEAGMSALWSAANIKVLGPGVDDMNFLRDRSEAIGEYDAISQSVSESKGGKSYSRSLSSSKTFSVNALTTLPRGRAIVFTSGQPAVLLRTVPWWEGEYSADVKKSIAQHDPQRKTEITDLFGSPSLTKAEPPQEYGQVEEVRPL
ncbi:TraM recognition domain-containing protein [Nocardia puris]|uniref:Type IV secretory pathway TraG/TraD family ATPase VirD4 n=1 Tax=Nocardia puris TaxID=208602 RepID=A0A366E1S5_9NOCA|nr:type IV secretory system conjugative DNA transfer family protein [Nocardia puris]MBF6209475.1 TraM recognition domain-containing protein [Nocardia puris]MBF6458611.1 TraM recognition domain-containing protein [Nocardia puris]RBO96263.1 type IV secretory pathway TraG/TraD family ATPase VirD4 [Nocardia puris]